MLDPHPLDQMGNRVSAALPSPRTPRRHASPAQEAEAAVLRAGLDAFEAMANSLDETNIFFVPSPGTDTVDFAEQFAKRGAVHLAAVPAEYAPTATALHAVEAATTVSRWTQVTAAIEWLMARQASHTLLYLPAHSAAASTTSSVHVYTRSPVEDMNVAIPVLLDSKLDVPMLTALKYSAEAAWHVLLARCPPATILWVYLRIADEEWHALCDSHRTHSGTTADTIGHWNAWRQRTDEFFFRDPFTLRYHTLVITVHNITLSNNYVVADVATIIARHINLAATAGAWGARIAVPTMAAFINTAEYQRARHATASQAMALRTRTAADTVHPAHTPRTIAGTMHLEFAPPPPPPAAPPAGQHDPFSQLPTAQNFDEF